MTDVRRRDVSTAALDATRDVLAAMAGPAFDLRAVLQEVAERATALADADSGNIAQRIGDAYRIIGITGLSEEYQRRARERVYVPEPGSMIGRTLLEGRVVRVDDVKVDPAYTLHDLQRAGGYRSTLGIPLVWAGETIGVIALGRARVQPFTDEDVAVTSLFGDQAALAIRIAELLSESNDALARERAVSDVFQAISQLAFELDGVLQLVTDRAVDLCKADFGNVARREGDAFQVVAFRGFDTAPEYERLERLHRYHAERGTLTGRVLLERRVIQIVDVLDDPEYTLTEMQRAGKFRTLLAVPMLRDGEPVGVIAVGRHEVRSFGDADFRLLQTFADQATVAIENLRLFQTVERQRAELARFAPQVASLLSSSGGEQLLAGHRREISALFADLRGFTAFAESAEPEEVLGVLREYHASVGELVVGNGGTVEHFAGDGLMAFFNDPTPLDQHELAAARTAIEVQRRFEELAGRWRRRGYDLGLGIGIALGYATLGRIGFEGRYDYGAVGNAVILASRLSDAAGPGEILVSQRFQAAVEEAIPTEQLPQLELKGFSRPVPAFRLVSTRD